MKLPLWTTRCQYPGKTDLPVHVVVNLFASQYVFGYFLAQTMYSHCYTMILGGVNQQPYLVGDEI